MLRILIRNASLAETLLMINTTYVWKKNETSVHLSTFMVEQWGYGVI